VSADDDLRAEITSAIDKHRITSFSRDGVRCSCGGDIAFTLMQWDEHRQHVADALLPVVRERLAQAWDEGFAEGHLAGFLPSHEPKHNPWREP